MKARYWVAGSIVAAAGAAAWAAKRLPRQTQSYSLTLQPGADLFGAQKGGVQFIGTATTIIRWRGITILTDPNFLHRGEQVHIGYGMHSTRLTDPAIDFDDLPSIDFVLLSHLHEDHFDKLVERRLARDTPVLTTASAARVLGKRGFRRCYPLRTWDRVTVRKGGARVNMTALPGTHGPLLVSAMLPDVMGSMLDFRYEADGSEYRMYISGDTLVFRDLKEIPRVFPNVELALLHLGGTRVMGVLLTMDGHQGIEALRIVNPDLAIPIHFDDYDVFRSPLEEFRREVERAGLSEKVRYLSRGETYEFVPRGAQRTVGQQPLV